MTAEDARLMVCRTDVPPDATTTDSLTTLTETAETGMERELAKI